MRMHSKEILDKLTPDLALEILKEGNQRFVNNLREHPDLLQQVNDTSNGQFPFATILSCIDSRTPAELIFDQGLGDIFSIRIAGNVINDDVLGSMEFGCKLAGSKVLVVLGHTNCGAIASAIDDTKLGFLSGLLEKITPSVIAAKEKHPGAKKSDHDFVIEVTEKNIYHTVDEVRKKSAILKQMEADGQIKIVPALYSVETGIVSFHEQ